MKVYNDDGIEACKMLPQVLYSSTEGTIPKAGHLGTDLDVGGLSSARCRQYSITPFGRWGLIRQI